MADDGDKKDVTDKEAKQNEEKEADTAEPKSPKAKSPTGSKPGSARSKTGSVKSTKSATGDKKATPAKGKGTKGKKKKEEEEKPATPAPEKEEDEGLPEGAVPIFLSSKTQEIFECRADEDVTDDNPFKFIMKGDIEQDFFNRAAVCDFHPVKETILNYPTDEILVVYDPDFKYGQNFIVALTEEAKEKLLKGPETAEEGEEGEGGEKEPEEEIIYTYEPPVSKPWVSLGSEKDISEEAQSSTRSLVTFTVKRKRREFGAFIEFADNTENKDSIQECAAYEDRTFDLKKVEMNIATQAVPEVIATATQTDWKYPRNACTQYEHREFSEDQCKKLEENAELKEFLSGVVPRFDLAVQQNNIMDVFHDDWANLGDDDSNFGSKADNHLKEYQSFTDLQFSKDKTVTCIDWHPSIRGVVAVSCGEKLSFDDRIDNAHRVIMTPSLILIWSFTDPIHPQLLLEAPDDITCFRFSPTDPNIIAGGCINGQVVMWDISQHNERLRAPRGGKKKQSNSLPGFEDENALDTPIVRYCAVSSIEHSHKAAITDLQWVPDHIEVNRMGVPHENTSGNCVQIMTCAIDYSVLFWDTRPPKTAQSLLTQNDKKKDEVNNPLGVPTTFKHLDLVWKPHLRVTLYKSEPGGDHSPTKFSIAERQGEKNMKFNEDGKKVDATNTAGGGFSFGPAGGRGGSGSAKRTLASVKTFFYVGTEDGEIVYCDWMPQKDQDTGKIQTPKPDYYRTIHDGAINTLQRSPFFPDIILVVGGWSFSIWKEGVQSGPILQSCASNKRYTAGHWSPSRPSVFFITRQDGSVDIWDLLDRTHEPSMNQSITPAPITCIFPYEVTAKQHLLGVGDNAGTLHILEIPWSLRTPTPNEMNSTANYFEREVKRRTFVVQRWDFREKEKMEIEQEKKNRAGIAPNVVLTDEEIEYRMKQEYAQFVEEEAHFLRELGLKEDVEEPLPETD